VTLRQQHLSRLRDRPADRCQRGFVSRILRGDGRLRGKQNIQASWPCMWPSTTTRAWLLPNCCPIRWPKPPSASCTRREFFARYGIAVRALLTDNGSCYRSRLFAQACQQMQIKHRRTKPYSPQTNGKAERFIQTALHEWAHAKHWKNSDKETNTASME